MAAGPSIDLARGGGGAGAGAAPRHPVTHITHNVCIISMGMDISDVAIPVTHFTLFEFTVCLITDKRKNGFVSLLALDVHQKLFM